jgi:tetratricopeptide (TPR) repeat protein
VPASLLERGAIRAAYDASLKACGDLAEGAHPFRSATDAASRWHLHGLVCWHNGRMAEAEHALEKAYAARLDAYGATNSDTLDTLERLAAVANYQSRHDLAAERFEQVIAGLIAKYGEGGVRVAVAQRNHAALLRDARRLPEARTLIDRATDVLERELPAQHADVIAALKVDAMLHIYEGSHQAAWRIAVRAVELGTSLWEQAHPFVANAELIAASAETHLKQFDRAHKRFPRIQKSIERAYGEHPMLAIAMSKRASLLEASGKNLADAVQLAREAVRMYRSFYPEAGGGMVWSLFSILMTAKRPIDAAELAQEIGDRISPTIAHAMAGRLANEFLKVGAYREALPWLERARDGCTDADVRAKWDAQVDKWTRYLRRFQ